MDWGGNWWDMGQSWERAWAQYLGSLCSSIHLTIPLSSPERDPTEGNGLGKLTVCVTFLCRQLCGDSGAEAYRPWPACFIQLQMLRIEEARAQNGGGNPDLRKGWWLRYSQCLQGLWKASCPEYLTVEKGLWRLCKYNGRRGTVYFLDTEHLSSIPRTNMVEGENWLLKVVLSSHTWAIYSMHMHTHTHIQPLHVKTSAFYHRFILNSSCVLEEELSKN